MVDVASGELFEVIGKKLYAVRVDSAKIGGHKVIGNERCLR